jgi:hypothetical protein
VPRMLRMRHTGAALITLLMIAGFALDATDTTLAELHLEAFLPADDVTAEVLRRRWV